MAWRAHLVALGLTWLAMLALFHRDAADIVSIWWNSSTFNHCLLVGPLIREFGVPRVFAYVARTPFRIENDNVRVSALRYQERARSARFLTLRACGCR